MSIRQARVTTHRRARSFRELIDLIKAAEERLAENGKSSVGERIHIIRGIYYGTTWSADYQTEKSPVRNVGFQTYTWSSEPEDPRPYLVDNLFEALRESRDVQDSDRHVDFSHLIIGLDARRNLMARKVSFPMQGGTGLELCTWLGDIGGGAGMLAKDRVSSPTSSALTRFVGLNFGGSNNLEGDVAGYLVARDKSVEASSSEVSIPEGKTLAEALEEYLAPGKPSSEWKNRCAHFLKMLGGTINGSGKLSNRQELVERISVQVGEFGCVYLVNRLRQNDNLTSKLLTEASLHLAGAAKEVAQVFVDALVYSHEHAGARLQARAPAPAVTPKATKATFCAAAVSLLQAKEEVEKRGKPLQKKAGEVEQGIKRGLREFERELKKYLSL